jgi:ATP-dependent exoDNAse (exonuclease V) beta subunit
MSPLAAEQAMRDMIKLAGHEVESLLMSDAWRHLAKDADKIFCEAPMAAVDGNDLMTAVADLLILTKSGDYRIVDFKTTQSDQKHARTLCQLRGYFDQVNHYRRILARCKPGATISGYVVFVNPVNVVNCD